MIPDAAVEAAWEYLWHNAFDRPASMEEMRAALEAAAPHFSSAWHDAVSSAYVDGALSAAQANVMYNTNPYRSQA